MKVSLITVVYNAESAIGKTIESVLSQTYTDIEYIIIDGKSTDNTLAIVHSYADKIHTIVSEKDRGIYDAMNKGIGLATGQIIGFLNAGDIYADTQIIAKVVTQLKDNDTGEALYGDLVYTSNKRVVRYWKSGSMTLRKFHHGWMPPHPTFFAKRGIYEKYGKFNTHFKISADYELMLRFLYKHKIRCIYLPQILVEMEVGGVSNQNLNNRLRANKEDRIAWRINRLRHPFYTPYLKPLLKIGQWFV